MKNRTYIAINQVELTAGPKTDVCKRLSVFEYN